MKKKLEADLISIAHRILKLKNKSELDQLYLETQQLYEKLAVLKFVETHFADAKPTIGHQEVTESLQAVFDQEEEVRENNSDGASAEMTPETPTAPEVTTAPDTAEEETEATGEEHETDAGEPEDAEETSDEHEAENADETEEEPSKGDGDIKPSFDISFEKKEAPKETPTQISFEDFLGNYTEPVFEKVSDKKEEPVEEEMPAAAEEEETPAAIEEQQEEAVAEEPAVEEETPEPEAEETTGSEEPEEKIEEETPAEEEKQPEPAYEPVQPTEKTARQITFGLNDRVGFEKHLFGGSSEDMNRVVSQLSTFDTFEEARDFIEDMVKPDYNNWEGKDDYAQRFLDIIERKFN